MEVTEFLLRRCREKPVDQKRLLVGLCGRAGAGKTTLGDRVQRECQANGVATRTYSGDWRFIRDSADRKQWLLEKWKVGIDAYLYAINQFSWWDFAGIQKDLEGILAGRDVMLKGAYDRETGLKDLRVEIPAIEEGIVCYENCILGGVELLERLDLVLLLNTPDSVSFERILRKDAGRRTAPEIAIRFLMTTYSENSFLSILKEKFSTKTFSCDSSGVFGPFPQINEVSHIPVPISSSLVQKRKRGTVFCDLDGTLIQHVPIPSETGDDIAVIDGCVEKLQEFRDKGYFVVLTTSRPQNKIFAALSVLKDAGIEFDQVISDLPVGPRHLINDSKGNEVRAFAHVLVRDEGITSVELP